MIKSSPMNLERIVSRDNRSLVEARKIRDGRDRSQIFIEGRRLVGEALRSPLELTGCFISEAFADGEMTEAIASRLPAAKLLPERVFDTLSATPSPQGIIVTAARPSWTLEDLEARLESSTLRTVVLLKEVNDPSNLGAVLRSIEAAGAVGLIATTNSADAYSPRSLRSAMGSAFRVPIIANQDLAGVIAWASSINLSVTAMDVKAVDSYADVDWTEPRLLIFGSEAHGLSDEELDLAGQLIKIPMHNDVESLNLAVSAGIVLFEGKRSIDSR